MKVWLLLYDVSSQYSNGYAVISANSPSLAATIFKNNSICRENCNIIGIKEIGETDNKQLSILSEGITSLGEQGIQGILGPKGDKGDSIQGPKGDTGIQGPIGPQGLLGIQGIQGILGIQGEKGDSFTFEDLTLELINQLALPALNKINEMNWSLYKRRIDAMYNWCVRYGMEPVN